MSNNKVVITITLENGMLGVNAPLENRIVVLGMIELAKTVIMAKVPETITDKQPLEVVEPLATQ